MKLTLHNSNVPPLNKGGNRNLDLEREREQLQPDSQSSPDGADTRDLEFFDFNDLRNNLDEYNDAEDADNIGDLLVEEGDDLNDETFGDEVVGKKGENYKVVTIVSFTKACYRQRL